MESFHGSIGPFDPGTPPSDFETPRNIDVEMTTEEDQGEADQSDGAGRDPVSVVQEDRIIIAIDFGTTFSSVAYVVLRKGLSPGDVNANAVKCIGNYPGYEPPPGVPNFRKDVPTELWYEYDGVATRRDPSLTGADDDENHEDDDEDSSSSTDDLSESEQSQFEDDGDLESNAPPQKIPARVPAKQYWGFGVAKRLSKGDVYEDETRPLIRFKLLLDQKEVTEHVRTDLRSIPKTLKKRNIIKNDSEIYTHFLTKLLEHTKQQLYRTNDFHQDMIVQFVLCVPSKWPMNACRIMQTALEEAVREADLGERANSGVRNMFMISEPEAAAESILAEAQTRIFFDNTVVVLDAGGGTVDAVTYKCETSEPLRLSAEVVAPDSKLCGASCINEEFEKKLLQKLASEKYLVQTGYTLESIVRAKTILFENNQKRTFNASDRTADPISITIEYLRENRRKDFWHNSLGLQRKTVRGFFKRSLAGAKKVLENQLELAESEGHHVRKVILTGGFGQSPSLQSHLMKFLNSRAKLNGKEIDLVVSDNPSTSVARGAVLRALNKSFGPDRITQCSYGFLTSEPFEPDVFEAHKDKRCRISKADGEKYINDTIEWVIQAGDRVNNLQEFPFTLRQTFRITKKKLVCQEELWMSDERHPSHYRKNHAMNKRAERVGYIIADFSFLIDEGLIQPQLPSVYSTQYLRQQPHWAVHYEVVMIVEGRSIQFEARWPSRENLKPEQNQRVLAMKRVGIAAAFKPGTA